MEGTVLSFTKITGHSLGLLPGRAGGNLVKTVF